MVDAADGEVARDADDLLASFELGGSVSHLLRRAHARAENIFATQLAPHSITPRQKAVLITIYQRPGCTLNEVADLVVLERQTTAEMVERLRTRGLVTRTRSTKDRRAYALHVSAEGHDLLRRIIELDRAVEAAVLSAVPAAHRDQLVQLLRQMAGRAVGRPHPMA